MPFKNWLDLQADPNCTWCKGTGTITKDGFIQGKNEKALPMDKAFSCLCTINPALSKKHTFLVGIQDVKSPDFINVAKDPRYDWPFIIFLGDEERFRYLVKCYAIKLFYRNKTMLFTDGINLIKEFYSATAEKDLIHITNYDLLVMLFTSTTPIQPLSNAVFESIRNRIRMKCPTWIFSKNIELLRQSQECNEELWELIKNGGKFKYLDINKVSNLIGWEEVKTVSSNILASRVAQENNSNI